MTNEGARERSRALVGDTWMLRNKAPGWVPCFVIVFIYWLLDAGCAHEFLSLLRWLLKLSYLFNA